MQFYEKKTTARWIIILASFCIVLLILWNTYSFFQIFKNEERIKMQQWALAAKTLNNATGDTDIELPFELIQSATIPIIVTSNDSVINSKNIDELTLKDTLKTRKLLQKLKNQNNPIVMKISKGQKHFLYYGDSSLLNKLKYYPIALLLIIFLFGTVVYNFYKSTKLASQNKLWAGMAKETAHQIGTPLSSLIGWLELLKTESSVEESTISEIEKDINRLKIITERFSKIGSEPILEKKNIVQETQESFDYLKSRFSNQIDFSISLPNQKIFVQINPELHSWTIENLMKNAIDAMKGKGKLNITIEHDEQFIKINVTDSGKGIPKNQYIKVFEPGFTTKKRGWGLGLSLTKRIVEEYHNGKIKVLQSEIGKGTTMQIVYKKAAIA